MSVPQLRSFLRRGPLRLQHVLLDQIIVLDHLGSNIPVPTIFCSKLEVRNHVPFSREVNCLTYTRSQDLRYIIRGYCKNRIGVKLIERGDFALMRSDDYQTVDLHNLAEAVQPGMVLEMSIILREKHMVGHHPRRCPRCDHINNAPLAEKWVEWCVFASLMWAVIDVCFLSRKCSGKFLVSLTKYPSNAL